MMRAGADIHALNTVRKHLSASRAAAGGERAAARPSRLPCRTWSATTCRSSDRARASPTQSTWADAVAALERFGGDRHPAGVRARVAGRPGRRDARHAEGRRSRRIARVDRPRHRQPQDALARRARAGRSSSATGAGRARTPVTGEARDAAPAWFDAACARLRVGPGAAVRDFRRRDDGARHRRRAGAVATRSSPSRWRGRSSRAARESSSRASAPTASTARPTPPAPLSTAPR